MAGMRWRGMEIFTASTRPTVEECLRYVPDKDFDPGPERWKKQEKLDAFKQRISQDQMPTLFTETTLGAKVLQALHNWRKRQEQPVEEEGSSCAEGSIAPVNDALAEQIRLYSQKADSLHASLPVASERCWSVLSHPHRPQRGHSSRRSSVKEGFDYRPAR
jgi:hypothetical protein